MSDVELGRWYEATYLKHNAPIFCRKHGDQVQAFGRTGFWLASKERAAQLMRVERLADPALVERRIAFSKLKPTPTHLAPSQLVLAPLVWYRVRQLSPLRYCESEPPMLYLADYGDGRCEVYNGDAAIQEITLTEADTHFEVAVNVDGDPVALTDRETANVDAQVRWALR
jgi:hypothetical protein